MARAQEGTATTGPSARGRGCYRGKAAAAMLLLFLLDTATRYVGRMY